MTLSWKCASTLCLSVLLSLIKPTSAAQENHVRGIIHQHKAWTNLTSTSITNAIAGTTAESSGNGRTYDRTSTLSPRFSADITASRVAFSGLPTVNVSTSTTNTTASILISTFSHTETGTSSTLNPVISFASNFSLTGVGSSGTIASSTILPAASSISNSSLLGVWTASTAVSSRVSEASITTFTSSHAGPLTSITPSASLAPPTNVTAFEFSSTIITAATTSTISGDLTASTAGTASPPESILRTSSCASCLLSISSTTSQPIQNQTVTVEIVTATDGTHRTTAVTWVSTEIPAGRTLSDGSTVPTSKPAWACSGSLCDPGCSVPILCPGGGSGGGGAGGFSYPKVPSVGPGSSSGDPKPGNPNPTPGGKPTPNPGKPNPTGSPGPGGPSPTPTEQPTATPTDSNQSSLGSSEEIGSTSSIESSSTSSSSSPSSTATLCSLSCTRCMNKRRGIAYVDDVNDQTVSDSVAVDPAPAPGQDPVLWFIDAVHAADKVEHVGRIDGLMTIGTSSALEREWPQDGHAYAVEGLFGCTSIIVTSRVGVWLSHIWEDPTIAWDPDHKEEPSYGGINDEGVVTPPFEELFTNLRDGNIGITDDHSTWRSEPLVGCPILHQDAYPRFIIVTPQVGRAGNRRLKWPKEVDYIQKWLEEQFDAVPISAYGYVADKDASEEAEEPEGKVLVQFNPSYQSSSDCGLMSNYQVWLEGKQIAETDTWLPETPAGQKRAICSTTSSVNTSFTVQTLTIASTSSTTTSSSSPSSTAEGCTADCVTCNLPANTSEKGLLSTRSIIGARTDGADAVSPSPVAGQSRPLWFLAAVNAAQQVPHLAQRPDPRYPEEAPPGLTSGVEALWGNDPKPLALVGLYGCTSIIVTSRAGAFVFHMWEGPTMSPEFGGGLTSSGAATSDFAELFNFMSAGGSGYELATGIQYSCDPLLGSTVIQPQYNPKIMILTPSADQGGPNAVEFQKEVNFIKAWFTKNIADAPVMVKRYTRQPQAMIQMANRPWGKLIVSYDPRYQKLNSVTGAVCSTSRHYDLWVEGQITSQTDDWTADDQKRDVCPTTLLTSTTSSNFSIGLSTISSSFNSSSMLLTSFASSTLNTTWSSTMTPQAPGSTLANSTTSTDSSSECTGPSAAECGMTTGETLTGISVTSTSMISTSSIIPSASSITSKSATRTSTRTKDSSLLTHPSTAPHPPPPKPTQQPQGYKLHIYQGLGEIVGSPAVYLSADLNDTNGKQVGSNSSGLHWGQPLIVKIHDTPSPHTILITPDMEKATNKRDTSTPATTAAPCPGHSMRCAIKRHIQTLLKRQHGVGPVSPNTLFESGPVNIAIDDHTPFNAVNNSVCHSGEWDDGTKSILDVSKVSSGNPQLIPNRELDCVLTF